MTVSINLMDKIMLLGEYEFSGILKIMMAGILSLSAAAFKFSSEH